MRDLIPRITALATRYSVGINDSCGLHVHVSNNRFFSIRNLRKIVGLWVAIEDVMFATQPDSRLENSFCKRKLRQYVTDGFPKIPAQKAALVYELGNIDRYYALNLASMSHHGTIECRLHSGTLNPEKILNWLTLLKAIYDYALDSYDAEEVTKLFKMGTSVKKVKKVWGMLGLSDEVQEHFNKRINRFSLPKLDKQQKAAHEVMKLRPLKDKANADFEKKMEEARKSQTVYQAIIERQSSLLNNTGMDY